MVLVKSKGHANGCTERLGMATAGRLGRFNGRHRNQRSSIGQRQTIVGSTTLIIRKRPSDEELPCCKYRIVTADA